MLQAVDETAFYSAANTLPGMAFNRAGILTRAPANRLRRAFDPETGRDLGAMVERSTINRVPNPRGIGAIPAVGGGLGTFPTGWNVTSYGNYPAVIRIFVLGTGVEDGIPFTRFRIAGYSATGDRFRISFMPTNSAAAALGQQWTGSWFARMVQINSGWTGMRSALSGFKGGVRVLGNVPADAVFPPLGGKLRAYRYIATAPMSVDVDYACLEGMFYCGAGHFDYTFDVGAPQLEQSLGASSPTFPDTAVVATSSRNADMLSFPLSSIDWPDAAPFTAYVAGTRGPASGVQGVLRLDNNSTTIVRLNFSSDTDDVQLLVTDGVAPATIGGASGAFPGQRFALGIRVDSAGSRLVSAGRYISRAANARMLTGLTTCRLGIFSADNPRHLNGPIDALRIVEGSDSDAAMLANTAALAAA